jgi:hypothetical protein
LARSVERESREPPAAFLLDDARGIPCRRPVLRLRAELPERVPPPRLAVARFVVCRFVLPVVFFRAMSWTSLDSASV